GFLLRSGPSARVQRRPPLRDQGCSQHRHTDMEDQSVQVLQANVTCARRRREKQKEERMVIQGIQIQAAVLATVLTIGGSVVGLAQSSQTSGDTYTWNGELVSLDTTAKTMTVKSRVAYQEAISELKNFKAGDRVWIVWSGIHDSSDAVRQVRRS